LGVEHVDERRVEQFTVHVHVHWQLVLAGERALANIGKMLARDCQRCLLVPTPTGPNGKSSLGPSWGVYSAAQYPRQLTDDLVTCACTHCEPECGVVCN
jgi:hypothetical protein